MPDSPETITQIEEIDRDLDALDRAAEKLRAKRKQLLYVNENAPQSPAASPAPTPQPQRTKPAPPAPAATQALPQQLPRAMALYANASVNVAELTASGSLSVWTLALRDLSRGPGAQQNHLVKLPTDLNARALCGASPSAEQQWWRAQADSAGAAMVCTECLKRSVPLL